MASRSQANTIDKLLSALEPSTYFCIATLQQMQWLCKELNIECEVFITPPDISSLISREDDPYALSPPARIIVIDESQQSQAVEALSPAHLIESDNWNFILLNAVGNPETYRTSVAKALDVKTKAATKLSKSAAKVLDLRDVPFKIHSELFNGASEELRENYKMFPYTAEFMVREQTAAEEVAPSWAWTNDESLIVELYKKLFSLEGVASWASLEYSTVVILKSMYERYDSGETSATAPVIVKTTAYYIRPFLSAIWDGKPHEQMLELYALWVYSATTMYQNALCPGLRERVSKGGRRYLSLSPSATAIKNWIELVECI